ncbi:hypothetical protein JVT61DRAFT_8525 [Boletus reticuloceps]|uniref:Uncharacterized protein n=1 Tax=Boletus reticuloceps TaxID=495285 RepID=A0A8I3AFF9_9AGAM|nr:hypothetical protein JVT61DRAFT_8525 [Boletus reticuloceps]
MSGRDTGGGLGDSHADDLQVPVQDVEEWFEHNPSTGDIRLVQAHKDSTSVLESIESSDDHLTGPSASKTSTASSDSSDNPCGGTKKDLLKLKAIFCRQRTNNEQLFVCPCGVICGRATMYYHEAIYCSRKCFHFPVLVNRSI